MVTGVNWYEKELAKQTKRLEKHQRMLESFKGTDYENYIKQLIHDDKKYINMLGYALENYMWHKDDRDDNFGWCADK